MIHNEVVHSDVMYVNGGHKIMVALYYKSVTDSLTFDERHNVRDHVLKYLKHGRKGLARYNDGRRVANGKSSARSSLLQYPHTVDNESMEEMCENNL